ncbi:Uncharacterised protein [uncultured archaeon]|nr:Uncharacterised protein [uncultured archaeon]
MIIRPVRLEGTFGKPSEVKSESAIRENLGKEVIIYDEHQQWCHGRLLPTGYDNEVYRMKIFDGRGERQLHYHDLQQLLVCTQTDADRKETGDFRKVL